MSVWRQAAGEAHAVTLVDIVAGEDRRATSAGRCATAIARAVGRSARPLVHGARKARGRLGEVVRRRTNSAAGAGETPQKRPVIHEPGKSARAPDAGPFVKPVSKGISGREHVHEVVGQCPVPPIHSGSGDRCSATGGALDRPGREHDDACPVLNRSPVVPMIHETPVAVAVDPVVENSIRSAKASVS